MNTERQSIEKYSSIQGKKCLITGASSGLGLALVKQFAKLGAEVIMLCRNEKKGTELVQSIIKETPNAKLQLEITDLASFQSVFSFIKRFKEKHSKLDILINNAAILKSKRTISEDGIETMLQVNYLGPFLITNALIDLMKDRSNPKIINIALPPKKLRFDFSDLQSQKSYHPMNVLFKTKLCLFLYSIELAEILKNNNISVITGIPNSKPFRSNLGRELPAIARIIMKIISVDVNKVAQNIIHFANGKHIETGHVFKGKKEVELIPYWKESDLRNKLRDKTNALISNSTKTY